MSTNESRPTIAAIQDEIVDEFALLDTWEDRYRYIIELGKKLPPMREDLRTEENFVRGCQSQVWLAGEMRGAVAVFHADSDAIIVRGLIALILRVFSSQTPSEILESTPDFIQRIGMSEHLSMTRANGLSSMIKQIKRYALAFQARAEE